MLIGGEGGVLLGQGGTSEYTPGVELVRGGETNGAVLVPSKGSLGGER
jgi:hypothetical protein